LGEPANDVVRIAVDLTSSLRLQPCDIFIGMSGMSLVTLERAKSLGALAVVERSSRHIVDQMRILGLSPHRPVVNRELAEYAAADVISVPSRHVEESFLSRGIPAERILHNPLGVDIEEFPWHRGPEGNRPLTVLFVGTRSFQKGADLFVEAARRVPEVRFVMVGSNGDVLCQPTGNLQVCPAVPQSALHGFYAEADVLVLPSRQDGFGMVMSQALASGCYVIASDHTGGPDLRALIDAKATIEPIEIIPSGNLDALVASIQGLSVDRLRADRGTPAPWRDDLSWRAYAMRYEANLLNLLRTHRQPRNSPCPPKNTRGDTAPKP
jgi:glycosyltransferase involved in cell wall biosynthesis